MMLLIMLIQVVAESLPISSSSHVALVEKLSQLSGSVAHGLPDFFDDLLHGPTILVLLLFFRRDWMPMARFLEHNFLRCGRLSGSYDHYPVRAFHRRYLSLFYQSFFFMIGTTTITVCFYLLFKGALKTTALMTSSWSLLVGLVVTMCMLLSLRLLSFVETSKASQRASTTLCAITLGIVQGFALLPGISRLGSTYVAGRWLGLSPRRALQTSCLMQFPLIVAAFFVNGLRGVLSSNVNVFSVWMALGVCLATLFAYGALWITWQLALHKRLWYAGMYLMVPIFVGLVITYATGPWSLRIEKMAFEHVEQRYPLSEV